MAATLDRAGYPVCCGMRLQPIMPKTWCHDCGEVYDYRELREFIVEHRRPTPASPSLPDQPGEDSVHSARASDHDAAAQVAPVGAGDATMTFDEYAEVNQGRRGPPHPEFKE